MVRAPCRGHGGCGVLSAAAVATPAGEATHAPCWTYCPCRRRRMARCGLPTTAARAGAPTWCGAVAAGRWWPQRWAGTAGWRHGSTTLSCATRARRSCRGRFSTREVVMPYFSHNSMPTQMSDGTLVVWHVGLGVPRAPYISGCTGGVTLPAAPPGMGWGRWGDNRNHLTGLCGYIYIFIY